MPTTRLEVHVICWQVIQEAVQILIQERDLSLDDAHLYLYELAQAGELLLAEVAYGVVREYWGLKDSHTPEPAPGCG
jgi:hypothetical protein